MKKSTITKVQVGAVALTAVLTISACGAGAANSTSQENAEGVGSGSAEASEGTLRVGTALNQMPWSYYDDAHEPAGIDVELCTEIGKRLGMDTEFVNLEFQGLIPGLQANRFDASCAGIYITPEREDVVSLIPYLTSGLSVVMQKDSDKSVASFDDLCGLAVSVLQGSSQEKALQEQNEKCEGEGAEALQITAFDGQPLALQELRNSRVDAFAASDQLSGYFSTEYEDLEVVVNGVNPIDVGIAVPKDNPELLNEFETALQEMSDDGTYEEILTKWGIEDSAHPDLG
jgi:polar amino acid transport system substrate-binding protein